MWLQRIVPQYLRRQWEWERLSDHPWWFHLIVGLERQLILKAYLFPPLERFIRATDLVFDTSNCIWLIGYTSIYFAHTNPVLNLFCDKKVPSLSKMQSRLFVLKDNCLLALQSSRPAPSALKKTKDCLSWNVCRSLLWDSIRLQEMVRSL